ncbi:hypothetical protein F5Y08DRAFT_303578 [Xylaria arbuscula]|nr:hypothetical protein F5Y08DRAFT_303578 [Xylaria arbuscula]
MAKFFAAILAAAALIQVGAAAPFYPATNTTTVEFKARHYNSTFHTTPTIHAREIRTFPGILPRP